jgi:hypothetical protein
MFAKYNGFVEGEGFCMHVFSSNIFNDYEKLLLEISDKNVDPIITVDLKCDMIATNPIHHTKKLSDFCNK